MQWRKRGMRVSQLAGRGENLFGSVSSLLSAGMVALLAITAARWRIYTN